MPQVINTNIMSLNSQRTLNRSQNDMGQALQRLSSGLRINSAKDDAAGLAISQRMTTQVQGLNQAGRNANDGVSMAQTAEGALAESTAALQRVRVLAVQSANATNTAGDRTALNQEVQMMIQEVDRIAAQTSFNGNKILSTSGGFAASFQIGANVSQVIATTIDNVSTAQLGVTSNYTNISGLALAAFAESVNTANVTAFATDTVNGVAVADIAASGDGVSIGQTKATAISAAANDVSAFTYGNSLVFDNATDNAVASASGDLVINGVEIGGTAGSTVAQLVTAINLSTTETGVEAVVAATGTNLVLVNSDGNGDFSSDAAISVVANTTNMQDLLTTGTTGTFTSSAGAGGALVMTTELTGAITLSANPEFGGAPVLADDTIATMNVNSVVSSNLTILAIDASLDAVNGLRARLGALQNRFDSVVRNLATTTENLSAARSRVQDADFASETAELTRAQILQQAGTAMLAQANVQPQNVLALLQ